MIGEGYGYMTGLAQVMSDLETALKSAEVSGDNQAGEIELSEKALTIRFT